MKRKLLRISLVSLIVTMVFTNNPSVLACTSFYLGSETTESGSSYWGRTEDSYAHFSKLHEVKEGQSHKAGDMWESTSGFKWPYPSQSLRYSVVKDSIHNEGALPEPYGQVGMNEENVAITATLTFYSRPEIIGKRDEETSEWLVEGEDPFVEGGLTEENVVSIVLMQAKTAREAVELIAQIVDTVGAGENGGIMVGDPNERWYVQLLSGRQYVAVKAPDDMIGLSPNMIGNVDLSDKENVICSAGLVRVPEAAGTLVKDEAGMIKIADSYGEEPSEVNSRLWLGHYYLFDQEKAQALTPAHIDYFIAPRATKDYTTYEALRLLAERGEGTSHDANKPENSELRPMGIDRTTEAHVFESRPKMPDQLATIQWLAMGPAEFSVYLPSYANLITETYDKYYQPDAPAYNQDVPDDNSFYWVFRELYTLSQGPREAADRGSSQSRARYGGGVKTFWQRYQESLIDQQKEIDGQMVKILQDQGQAEAERLATDLSVALSKETYRYAKEILSELRAFQEAGTQGDFVPSALADQGALPHYKIEGREPAKGIEGLPTLVMATILLTGVVMISKKE